jgi:glycosyltransferase involved in cell wall biosynthesis
MQARPRAVIVALFPELCGTGGIQRSGRLAAAALTLYASQHSETCAFLTLNDQTNTSSVRIGSQQVQFTGFGRSKRRFVAAAWRAAGAGPRLVVALHPNLAPIVAAMKFRSPRMRSVIFAHGVEVWTPLSLLRRQSLGGCDLALAPSAYTVARLIEQQGTKPEKTGRLAWSLGPEFGARETSPASLTLPTGFPCGRIILTVGRWDAGEAYKGVDHLIAALPELLQDVPDLHLVAIGGGSDLPRLEQLARQSGAAEHIHFLPFLAPEKLDAAYDFCDVFALPSRGEGFGLVFLEAMSHCKPVVGGAHGGTPDIIEDGVNGYLVQYGEVAALTGRLRQLLTDEPLRRRMGAAACDRVVRDFMFERFSAEFTARLDALLALAR